ncbi:MAG: NUDIX hydrolase [Chloroflexi bacterium]|nr:NUDIX hydrolase [Chloroflexota bacterium]
MGQSGELTYCPRCGHRLAETLLETEDRPRLVCTSCAYVFYQNPRIVAGAIPIQDGRVVLLRRGIEPRHGYWTFPSGFMELGETAEQAAVREAKEETNLEVAILSLLSVYTRIEAGTVAVVYLARVVGGAPQINKEALEIATFLPQEIPWDDLAFESTRWALRDWVRRWGER